MQYTENFTQKSFSLNDLPLFTTENVVPVKYSQVVKPVAKALEAIFVKPEPDDKEILEARKILGELAKDLSSEEVRDILTEIQFLVDSWLDDYEKQIFEGKTLKELLHEKGRL